MRRESGFLLDLFKVILTGRWEIDKLKLYPMNYYISQEGSTIGPFSREQLVQMCAAGSMAMDSLVWDESLAEWRACRDIVEVREFGGRPRKGISSRQGSSLVFLLSGLSVLGCLVAALLGMIWLQMKQDALKRDLEFQAKTDVQALRAQASVVTEKAPERYDYQFDLWSRDDPRFLDAGKKLNLQGWEYVGPLCNNGLNAQYVLFRRPQADRGGTALSPGDSSPRQSPVR